MWIQAFGSLDIVRGPLLLYEAHIDRIVNIRLVLSRAHHDVAPRQAVACFPLKVIWVTSKEDKCSPNDICLLSARTPVKHHTHCRSNQERMGGRELEESSLSSGHILETDNSQPVASSLNSNQSWLSLPKQTLGRSESMAPNKSNERCQATDLTWWRLSIFLGLIRSRALCMFLSSWSTVRLLELLPLFLWSLRMSAFHSCSSWQAFSANLKFNFRIQFCTDGFLRCGSSGRLQLVACEYLFAWNAKPDPVL